MITSLALLVYALAVRCLYLFARAQADAEYRRRLEQAVPLTPGSLWLLLLNAQILRPPEVWRLMWLYGLIWIAGSLFIIIALKGV